MIRRACIFALSSILSLAVLLATMQLVCVLVDRIFQLSHKANHNVIWIVPK